MSSSGLTALQLKRNNYMQLKLQANDYRAKFARKERDIKEALEREEAERRRKKEEEDLQREFERAKAEKEFKTKEYFGLNKAFRIANLPNEPVYYGDNIVKYGAWFPHGFGEMSLRGVIKYSGEYKKGKREGKGTLYFDDESIWCGMFRNGNAHGSGVYTPPPIPVVVPGRAPPGHKDYNAALEAEIELNEEAKRELFRSRGSATASGSSLTSGRKSFQMKSDGQLAEFVDALEAPKPAPTHIVLKPSDPVEALMKDNIVICVRKDLIEGKQLEFNDSSLAVTSTHCDYSLPRAILIRHVKKWRYLFRFQDQVVPREREVNLEFVHYFKILHHLPIITVLSHIHLPMDEDGKYDYYKDNYGTSGSDNPPFLSIAIGRRDENMRARGYLPPLKAKDREHVDPASLNMFESGLSGIVVAKELEQQALQIANRKLQWAKLVDKKRDEAEAERRRQIEESHALLAEQEQREKEEMARQAALEVEDAMSKYSASRHSVSLSSAANQSQDATLIHGEIGSMLSVNTD